MQKTAVCSSRPIPRKVLPRTCHSGTRNRRCCFSVTSGNASASARISSVEVTSGILDQQCGTAVDPGPAGEVVDHGRPDTGAQAGEVHLADAELDGPGI